MLRFPLVLCLVPSYNSPYSRLRSVGGGLLIVLPRECNSYYARVVGELVIGRSNSTWVGLLGLFAKKLKNRRSQLLRAPRSMYVGRRNSMQVDEGRKGWSILAIKTKTRAEVGNGEKNEPRLSDPVSEWQQREGRKKKKGRLRTW